MRISIGRGGDPPALQNARAARGRSCATPRAGASIDMESAPIFPATPDCLLTILPNNAIMPNGL